MGILLWFDVCWRYGVVRLGWCGILMQAEASVGLSLFNYVEPSDEGRDSVAYRLTT